MQPNQTLRAPGTIVKPSRPNTYTGYLAQNKLKLIGSILRDRPASSTSTNNNNNNVNHLSHQAAPNPQTNPHLQTTQQQMVSKGSAATSTITATKMNSTTATNITSRIPMKPSRLVKPTPIKPAPVVEPTSRPQPGGRSNTVASSGNMRAHNTTSALKPPSSGTFRAHLNTTYVNTHAQLAALNHHPVHSTVSKPSLKPPNPANLIRSIEPTTLPKLISFNESTSNQRDVTSENQVSSSSSNTEIFQTGVREDVSHIRQLLEQLLTLLKSSSDDQEELAAENERLRMEVAELKEKIRAIKSTISTARDSTSIPEEIEPYESSTKDEHKESPPRLSVYSTPTV